MPTSGRSIRPSPLSAGPPSSPSQQPRTLYTQFRKHVPCYCLPNWPGECPGHNSDCQHSYWAHTPARVHGEYVAATLFCIGCQSRCYPGAPTRATALATTLSEHYSEHAYHIFVHRFKLLCNKAAERRAKEPILAGDPIPLQIEEIQSTIQEPAIGRNLDLLVSRKLQPPALYRLPQYLLPFSES